MLNHEPITKELKTIETLKSTLFTFFDTTKKNLKILQEKLKKILSPLQLNAFCRAWQYNKAVVKAKGAIRRNKAKNSETSILENLKNGLNTDYQYIKDMIYNKLDQSIQSSAAVENINSILRPFLNTIKNNVTQQALNLFMFFHNHRIFKNGKRKGKSPLQILTGNSNEDVIDLILKKMEA